MPAGERRRFSTTVSARPAAAGGGGDRGGDTAGTEQRGGDVEEGIFASVLMFLMGSGRQVKGQSMTFGLLCCILNRGKDKAVSLTQME